MKVMGGEGWWGEVAGVWDGILWRKGRVEKDGRESGLCCEGDSSGGTDSGFCGIDKTDGGRGETDT